MSEFIGGKGEPGPLRKPFDWEDVFDEGEAIDGGDWVEEDAGRGEEGEDCVGGIWIVGWEDRVDPAVGWVGFGRGGGVGEAEEELGNERRESEAEEVAGLVRWVREQERVDGGAGGDDLGGWGGGEDGGSEVLGFWLGVDGVGVGEHGRGQWGWENQ